MLISKLKVVSALVLAVGILGAGAGFFKPAADAGEGEQPTQAATKQIKTKDAGTKNKAVTRHTGKLDQTMAVVLDIDFQDMPLKDILDNFRKTYGMNVIIDKPALNDAGLSLDGSITLSLDKVPLKTALKHILHDVSLTYRIEDDILIVSPQQENNLLTEIYAVEELVMHQGDDKTQEVALIRIITSTVMPKTWQTIGGAATIEFFPVGNSLVVNQTEEGHERIKALLEKLRAAKAKNDERRPQA